MNTLKNCLRKLILKKKRGKFFLSKKNIEWRRKKKTRNFKESMKLGPILDLSNQYHSS